MKEAIKMRVQSAVFDDVFDQIHEEQIEGAKLADDNPLKPVLRELFALYGEMTEKLRYHCDIACERRRFEVASQPGPVR
jgi:hypothetical protein